MKNIFWKAVVLVCLLIVISWVISNKITEKQSRAKQEKLETEKRSQTTKLVAEMIAKHNAVADWRQQIPKVKNFGRTVYTIELEDALVKTDGRPVLLLAAVRDIVKESEKYSVHIVVSSDEFPIILAGISSVVVQFSLLCTQEQVDKILPRPRSSLFEHKCFAVVARISEVRKIRLEVNAYGETYDECYLGPSENTFSATGECLDVLFIGDYRIEELLGTDKGKKAEGKKAGGGTLDKIFEITRRVWQSF